MALFGGGNDIRIRFLADTTQVGTAVTDMGSGISKGLGIAGIGWAAAGAAAVAFGKQSIDAAMGAEDAQKHLADAYAKFPALHDASLQSLNALADATLQKTRYDDEAARAAEAVLAQYSLTGQQILTLLPLVEDFAAKTGKDLPTAAEAIGKALLGNTRALKEVGINYKLTGDKATDYAAIVKLLGEQVGGAAAADAETTAGKLAQLSNQYGELKEKIGAALLPLIQALAPALIAILQTLAMSFEGWGLMIQWVIDHAEILGRVLSILGGPFLVILANSDLVTAAFSWLGDTAGNVAGILFGALGGAIGWVTDQLGRLWGAVVDVADWVGGVFSGAWDAARGAIDAVARAVGWLIDKLKALKSLWDSVTGFIGKVLGAVGLAAPAPPGGHALALAGAPTLGAAAYGAPRSGAPSGDGGGLVVNVNVHGNVGDPNVIGRRVVEALRTYTRTNGARALRQNLGVGP